MPKCPAIACVLALGLAACARAEPRGILIDLAEKPVVLGQLAAGDAHLVNARDTLVAQADDAMRAPVRPVTEGKADGNHVAPSGDPHDYVSLSPYWWPNPHTDDGLPYIRKDGQVNPDRNAFDTPKLGDMGSAVRTLGFAYFITGEEKYAERAIDHVRAWFVDPATRMNPNMRYSQFIPGVADGRHVGIVDTNRLRWVPDALLMLSESPAWTTKDEQETKRWFSEYVDWLLTSGLGKEEREAKNNHGTWFAAQAAYYALYAGRDDVARELVESIPARIGWQIEPDGRQPLELVRTNSLDYSEFNIRAMLDLCKYAQHVGFDLAGYKTDDGRSIRAAIDFVLPYETGEKAWPYDQIKEPKRNMYYQGLRVASRVFDEPRYEKAAEKIGAPEDDMAWVDLLLPAKR
ncbi:MAG: alginate lyase family protein [Phycisphaeraceae bacterium]|nr:MAG: alginate lyase family protein [Phycisphaeraceae bacterium]